MEYACNIAVYGADLPHNRIFSRLVNIHILLLSHHPFPRSFIKGSIEAVMHGRPLTLTEYLALGAKYCRLNPGQRREAYTVYEKYASWLESNNYYDSCDRTVDLLNRIRRMSIEDRVNNNIRFDIIYVDGETHLRRYCTASPFLLAIQFCFHTYIAVTHPPCTLYFVMAAL